MDSITQAALGAVVGERILGRQLGRRALAWGALIGTLPDLDVVANGFLDYPGELFWHRGFSHSIVAVIVAVPLFAALLSRQWRGRVSVSRCSVFLGMNFVSHVLIDCFTVYGTQIFEPFSRQRVGFNNFFIIDPVFTLPLLLWILMALIDRGRITRNQATVLGLWICGYVAFSFASQHRAGERFAAELRDRGISAHRGQISAAPLTTLIWRGIFETDDAFWISHYTLNDDESPLKWYRVPRRVDGLKPLRDDRAVDCVLWFSEGYLAVEETDEGGFIVTDLRFFEFWPDGNDGGPRNFFTWQLAPAKAGLELKPLVWQNAENPRSILLRLLDRWNGNRDALGP